MPLPITPPRLDLADRQRGLRAVDRLIDRLKLEGLGLVGIQAVLRMAAHFPKPVGAADLDPELRYKWNTTANRLEAAGMVTIQRDRKSRAKITATLTPRAQRILGL